ncbi:MAG: hypothetical protein KF819_24360 [Labilithrix sp.]|nr:hypothetical protein [Labilithrix sp.]
MDWQTPLLVSAVAFAAFMIFRFRPVISGDGRATAAALKGAKQQIAAAKDDAARAKALCDAADASARLGRFRTAVSFYLRAVRAEPGSKEIVQRASVSLARRPAALEKVLWQQLAASPWTGEARDAARIALEALAQSYAKRPRFAARARAIEHALDALGGDAG